MSVTSRLPLARFHQSGATDGQVPVWDDGAGMWVPDDVTGGGSGSSLPWFDVTDYGAANDNSTDDLSAINDAIADLNAAGAGVLYFPGGAGYATTAGLDAITALCRVLGDGSGDAYSNAASVINCSSATAYAMTLNANGIIVQDLCIANTNGSESAGAGIRATLGERNQYRNVSIYGFYDCMTIENGGVWTADACWFTKPVRYGLYIRNIASPDGGDQVITACNFYAKDRDATSAIRLESGGGLKLVACKINTNSGTGYFDYGLDINLPTSLVTGVLTVTGCSIENVDVNAVRMVTAGSGNYDMVAIVGNEMAMYTSGSTAAIDLNCATSGNISEVVLSGLTLRANPSRAVAAINLTNVVNAVIGDRVIDGFSSAYATSGGSSVVDGMAGEVPAARTITAGTLLTGGGDLSADRTIDVDEAALETFIDGLGATSYREVVMSSDGTATPITNSAGDDWLYGEVST